MVKSVSFVKETFISQGSGYLDFEKELREIKPDYFVINEDGNTPAKRALCEEIGVEYIILQRKPSPGLEARSTTALRRRSLFSISYRPGRWMAGSTVCFKTLPWSGYYHIVGTYTLVQRTQWHGFQHPQGCNRALGHKNPTREL